jgi:hypothetical protein
MSKRRRTNEPNVEQARMHGHETHMPEHETHAHNLDKCQDHENCRQFLSSLSEYVDGALSGELCVELERHMKDCQRCRVVVNTMKRTIELYQETGEETHLPDDVRERLFLRLNLEDFLK